MRLFLIRITILVIISSVPAYLAILKISSFSPSFFTGLFWAGVRLYRTQHQNAKQKRAYRPLLHTSVQITDIYINAPWDGLSFLIRHAHADAFPVAQVILHEAQRLAEPLEVDDFPFAQEP